MGISLRGATPRCPRSRVVKGSSASSADCSSAIFHSSLGGRAKELLACFITEGLASLRGMEHVRLLLPSPSAKRAVKMPPARHYPSNQLHKVLWPKPPGYHVFTCWTLQHGSSQLREKFVLLLHVALAEVSSLQLGAGGDTRHVERTNSQSKMPLSPAHIGNIQVSQFLQKSPVKTWSKEGSCDINTQALFSTERTHETKLIHALRR
ncbi:uncharacterized protein [Heliangelus exortis]|uniref:uncharacterized protein n=1 Tax=Heliangelus exortis TaxID=472823 RepID=UPI003A934B32